MNLELSSFFFSILDFQPSEAGIRHISIYDEMRYDCSHLAQANMFQWSCGGRIQSMWGQENGIALNSLQERTLRSHLCRLMSEYLVKFFILAISEIALVAMLLYQAITIMQLNRYLDFARLAKDLYTPWLFMSLCKGESPYSEPHPKSWYFRVGHWAGTCGRLELCLKLPSVKSTCSGIAHSLKSSSCDPSHVQHLPKSGPTH